MTTTTAIPVKNGSAFQHISGSRKIANSIATAVVWGGAMIIAMIPLVWVLWELIARGSGVIFSLSGGRRPSAAS